MAYSHAEIDDRRQQVAALRRQGRTMAQIARELGVSTATISIDVRAMQVEWQELHRRDHDAWMMTELAKLDALEAAAWEQVAASKGRMFGIDRVLAIMDRRAKLLGLDAPTKIDLTQSVRAKAEEIARENDLSVDDVMAEMEAILAGRPDSTTIPG
jgi:orotate phosphoribosyltransferase-like protein